MSKRYKKPVPLLLYADELVEALRANVTAAVKAGDENATHQARVASRRLTAAIDVFKPISSGDHRRELTKTLRKVRKALGPLRDLDVMLGHLDELSTPGNQPAIAWAREMLVEKLRKSRESAAADLDVPKVLARLGSWWGVREEWAEAAACDGGLQLLIADSLHLQWGEFVAHADGISGTSGNEFNEAANAALLDPHQLRIAGKALRYTLELAVAGGFKLPAAVSRAFKRMQDALGLWHDYVVLNDQLLKLVIGHRDAPTVLGTLDLGKLFVRRSQRQLDAFIRIWKQRGPALADSIQKVFPLTEPVEPDPISESQTDRDPPGLPTPPESFLPPPQGESSAA